MKSSHAGGKKWNQSSIDSWRGNDAFNSNAVLTTRSKYTFEEDGDDSSLESRRRDGIEENGRVFTTKLEAERGQRAGS